MEMRTGDVDSNDWMEAFDEWQREVLRGLLVTFGVTPPEAYVAAVNSGAAAGEAHARHTTVAILWCIICCTSAYVQLGLRFGQHMHRCKHHSMHVPCIDRPDAAAAAAGEAKARLHLRVLDASEPGQPLTVAAAVEQLKAARRPEGYDLLEVRGLGLLYL
jgi:hypothetical protein